MQRNQNLLKLFFLFIGLFGTPFSQAATYPAYTISFFNQNGTKVGYGHFTTDPNRRLCVEVSELGNCNNNPSMPDASGITQYSYGYVSDELNPLTSFSANILGINWGFEAGKTWWTTSSGQPPGSQGFSRYEPHVFISNSWFFGDSYTGSKSLLMDFDETNIIFGKGTWAQHVINPSVHVDGTWTATLVPIPPALLLFISGLGIIGIYNHKKHFQII